MTNNNKPPAQQEQRSPNKENKQVLNGASMGGNVTTNQIDEKLNVINTLPHIPRIEKFVDLKDFEKLWHLTETVASYSTKKQTNFDCENENGSDQYRLPQNTI